MGGNGWEWMRMDEEGEVFVSMSEAGRVCVSVCVRACH
jgi:hypothetical protein